jgi:hypothetical protein
MLRASIAEVAGLSDISCRRCGWRRQSVIALCLRVMSERASMISPRTVLQKRRSEASLKGFFEWIQEFGWDCHGVVEIHYIGLDSPSPACESLGD